MREKDLLVHLRRADVFSLTDRPSRQRKKYSKRDWRHRAQRSERPRFQQRVRKTQDCGVHANQVGATSLGPCCRRRQRSPIFSPYQLLPLRNTVLVSSSSHAATPARLRKAADQQQPWLRNRKCLMLRARWGTWL